MMRYKDMTLREHDGEWYFEDSALAESYDPKAPDRDKRQEWMDSTGAVKSRGRRCLGQVAYGRGHTCGRQYGRFVPNKPACQVSKSKYSEWFDHRELFWLPERRVYVLTAQPYSVTLGKVQEMEAFAKAHGMQVDISIQDAWWYPGRTPLIVWSSQKGESDDAADEGG